MSLSFLSKSSDLGWHHQKQPLFRQHFLNRLPLPHGQRSLRPSFSSRSLSPCTMRTPRPTCVSDGNPFRRLLIVSKKMAVRRSCVWTWDTSIRDTDQELAKSVLARNRTWSNSFGSCHAIQHTHGPTCQYLDLESNQDLDFRRVPCGPLHYRDTRADDWIRTSMNRFTKAAPFYVEPRRQIRSRPEDRERFTSTFPNPRSSRLR